MFSRTTMASSMRRPIASDGAMSLMMFSVIPRKCMAMNEEMTEIGSVSPVMTVERQELRKRKTIRTVRMPPMIEVVVASWTDSLIMIEPSLTSAISPSETGTRPRVATTMERNPETPLG